MPLLAFFSRQRQFSPAGFRRDALHASIPSQPSARNEDEMNDLRFALRQLLKNPAFTIIAVFALALGIGANTAIFSVVYGVLLKPLPFPEQQKLVFIREWSEQVPGMSVSYPNFIDWRERQQSFSAIGVVREQSFNLTGVGRAERISGAMATHDLFAALKVRALRG